MLENGRKVSIVMVDDDDDDCFVIREALAGSQLDYDLTIFGSGSEFLDFLRGRGKYARAGIEFPDLILLDLYMPGMSGMDVLRHMQDDPGLRKLDVVVLTDATEWSALAECYHLGAAAVFTKSLWLHTFAELIRISGHYWFKFVTFKARDPHQHDPGAQDRFPGQFCTYTFKRSRPFTRHYSRKAFDRLCHNRLKQKISPRKCGFRPKSVAGVTNSIGALKREFPASQPVVTPSQGF
jgi:CheY-like chemotaxis protein